MKKRRLGEIEALYFDKLPQRAKEIFFEFLSCEFPYDCSNKAFFIDVTLFGGDNCKSPIEQIFSLAFEIMNFASHSDSMLIVLESQVDIYLKNKHYVADFLFNTEEIEEENFQKMCKPYKLVIECDGHEFHEKTKEQVKKNNERDYDLKMAGYDVLHFSGSQIYNEPFRCAKETLDLIYSKILK